MIGVQLVLPLSGEVALCLEQGERAREPDGHALLFGLETPHGELARLLRGLDPLQVGRDLSRRVTDRGRDLQLQIAQVVRALLALQTIRCDGGIGDAATDWIAELKLHAPGPEVVAEHVAESASREAALRLAENWRREGLRVRIEHELSAGQADQVVAGDDVERGHAARPD